MPRRTEVPSTAASELATCGLLLALTGCLVESRPCIDPAALWEAAPLGPVSVLGDLDVSGRSEQELHVLASVEAIAGSLRVHDNPTLTELPALPLLTHIDGALAISDNLALTRVHGFPALEQIGGEVYIADNLVLQHLEIGDALTSAGSLFVAVNPSLERFDGMPRLAALAGDLRLVHHIELETVAFPNLTEVGGGVFFVDNPALNDIDLTALTSASSLELTRDHALESLDGFAALRRVDEVRVAENSALADLPLPGLTVEWMYISDNDELSHIHGADTTRVENLFISGNPRLTRVTGFADLLTMDLLHVLENDELSEFAAFDGLRQVYELSIVHNPSLGGPPGWFPALTEIEDDLSIFDNPSLPPATVDALVARIAVGGAARVGDNQGQMTALDPCPWPNDGICDGPQHWWYATALCLEDPEDCDV
jgi:hypothetical protein